MRVILYARVSTRGQAEKGYSLRQQIEALEAYASQQGWGVVAVIEDDGYSGATLERPGMDRVREIVETGSVDLVVAQDRDRIAREPAFHYLLETEFIRYSTKLTAINDWGGDTPEGQLLRGIQDQVAKYERLLTTERTRQGKLRRAKEGKIVPVGAVPFDFSYTGDSFEVDEETMPTVRRVFQLVAAGDSLHAIRRKYNGEGVSTPSGGKFWSANSLSRMVRRDAYYPHTHEELSSLASHEVVGKLDPGKFYGVFWYGDIAVPVEDAGIPRKTVEAARANLTRENRQPRGDNRFWSYMGTCSAPVGV